MPPKKTTAAAEAKPTPTKETPPERGPLDPIARPLWRYKRAERRKLTTPFIGKDIKIERWLGRVASHGDKTYTGTLLAIATTTIGSASNLLILQTVDGTVWAISDAQVAYLELKGTKQ